MNEYLTYILNSFFYNIIDALAFAVALGILMKVITWITPLKNWEKIRENSITLTIVLVVILIIFGAYVISGYFVPETSQVK